MSDGVIHAAGDIVSGRYKILSYVSAGGMQEVYLAADELLGRRVALKTPKNESAAKRFQRSAIVSARVNHANIAKTLDYFEFGGRAYLVEEFILGNDLGWLLKERYPVLDPLMAGFVLHRLAKGLAASHHAGVVHRDLKPSNVMAVGGEKLSDVKITDFGIAKMAEEEMIEAVEGGDDSITASQTVIGAIPYMAPEAINAIKDAGTASDVWSLGAMAFELISGKKPFGFGLKAIPAILKGEVPSLPGNLSAQQFKPSGDAIYQVIKQCLQLDPKARLTADQLVVECESLCYPSVIREFGTIKRMQNSYFGFIQAETGGDLFFHVDSLFGSRRVAVGDRIWCGRFPGGGADRAFPVLKVKT
jgi:serine/threonine-protein kinase